MMKVAVILMIAMLVAAGVSHGQLGKLVDKAKNKEVNKSDSDEKKKPLLIRFFEREYEKLKKAFDEENENEFWLAYRDLPAKINQIRTQQPDYPVDEKEKHIESMYAEFKAKMDKKYARKTETVVEVKNDSEGRKAFEKLYVELEDGFNREDEKQFWRVYRQIDPLIEEISEANRDEDFRAKKREVGRMYRQSSSKMDMKYGAYKWDVATAGTLDNDFIDYVKSKYNDLHGLEVSERDLGQWDYMRDDEADRVLEKAKAYDYPSVYIRLKDGNRGADDYSYRQLIQYKDRFTTYYESVLLPVLNAKLEEAYRRQSTDKAWSMKTVKRLKTLQDAAVRVWPEHPKMKMMTEDISSAYATLVGEHLSKVAVSAVHAQNMKKILFSTSPIEPGKETAAQFQPSFTINDNVYGIVYLDRGFKDMNYGSMPSFEVRVYVDGNWHNTALDGPTLKFSQSELDRNASTVTLNLLPDPSRSTNKDAAGWARVLAGLSPRRHDIKIELVNNSIVEAAGELSINLAGMNADDVRQRGADAAKKADDNLANAFRLPASWNQPASSFTDAGLSLANLKAMILSQHADQVADVVVMKVIGTNGDWITHKNALGAPTEQVTARSVYAVLKGKDGWCYFTDNIWGKREHVGGGKYGNIRIFLGNTYKIENLQRMNCDNVR